MEQQADIIWDVPRALRTHVHPDVFVQQRRLYCIFKGGSLRETSLTVEEQK